ncbi:hypothetical protein MKL09_29135 [Methylobacterium sp. J-048]|uniref:hypothetical protein n=1 Tax=Methylobacterium sp. J-048 TaxID=2836635 RepID=UPI001FBAEEA2|nr:hypothetical protein [Methylobacterium sp. J-048]MCJ2060578.1 hypothetical protein [Methylobacterium sp. J-048]
MATPKGLDSEPDTFKSATLARLAKALGCSQDRFSEEAPAATAKDTSQLIQMWLAIKAPEGREAVFAFVREVLRSEAQKRYGGVGM